MHFSSLIPKMLMFTLATLCLTTCNLPWFLNVTFWVPMQFLYSIGLYFHHQSHSQLGGGVCFVSVSSDFLELFLHCSPVAYCSATNLGSSSFTVLSFYLLILFMGFSRQEYWSGFPFLSPVNHILSFGSYFVHWIIEKAGEFQKYINFCFIDYAKAFDCVDHNKLWKILKEMGIKGKYS